MRTLLSGTGHNADELKRVGMHQDLGCIKSYDDESSAYIRFDGVCILMAGALAGRGDRVGSEYSTVSSEQPIGSSQGFS